MPRSDHDYPHLVAQATRAELVDVSCSGAETADLFSAQALLGHDHPPQLDALDPGVAVVSLQIGGNDIGFSEFLGRCLSLLPFGAPCRDHYTRGGVDEISRRIAAPPLAGQAGAGGAAYVDLYGPSIGHDVCQLPGTRWVEPLVPASPAAPVHPNALGMQAMADVFAPRWAG